jgi:hypothetical protein
LNCGALLRQKRRKKYIITNFLFYLKISGKLFFGLMTRKMAYYYKEFTRKLPDFDPESARRPTGIRPVLMV